MRKIAAVCGTLIASMASIFAFTAPAQASGSCPQGSDGWAFCLYYNSYQQGAYYRWTATTEVSNLAGYTYPNNGNGSGWGQPVKNNSASASYGWNGSASNDPYIRVYYNSGYLGNYDTVGAGHDVQLVNTKNNDASWRAYCISC